MKNKSRNVFLLIIISFHGIFLGGCDDYFEFSPYEAEVDSKYRNTTSKELIKLYDDGNETSNEFKFAVLADSHYWYHELDEAIKNINNREDIEFVICSGDIADGGLLTEFELFHEAMDKLIVPYFTVIGNHDYLSNGEEIYDQMFGKRNYSYVYKNCSFIFFDDVFWESNDEPDFEWLENELKQNSNSHKKFVISHLPPFAIEFDSYEEGEEYYSELMKDYHVDLSIHGHVHHYSCFEPYRDGVKYLTVDAANDKGYSIVTVSDQNGIEVEQVKY